MYHDLPCPAEFWASFLRSTKILRRRPAKKGLPAAKPALATTPATPGRSRHTTMDAFLHPRAPGTGQFPGEGDEGITGDAFPPRRAPDTGWERLLRFLAPITITGGLRITSTAEPDALATANTLKPLDSLVCINENHSHCLPSQIPESRRLAFAVRQAGRFRGLSEGEASGTLGFGRAGRLPGAFLGESRCNRSSRVDDHAPLSFPDPAPSRTRPTVWLDHCARRARR